LRERRAEPLRVVVIWEPVLDSDTGPPTVDLVAAFDDPRVARFWDPKRVTSAAMQAGVRAAPKDFIGAEKALEADVIWDVVALHPAGQRWDASYPPPVWWDAPVVQALQELRDRINK
jgi:hypothetical protein